ncbi:MAG: potassium transporter, partial [Mycobacterium sp.]|nr:potassium transporter [Mycobacterium sp.]
MHPTSETAAPPHPVGGGTSSIRPAVVVGALGVVFGDIGPSPIYTIQTV